MAPSSTSASAGTIPKAVAIIMDGNGRWAAGHDLPVEAGHREGTRALRRTVEAAIDLGISTLVVYAFSTENWARPVEEVATLMTILSETIDRELPDLAKQGVRTRFMGRRDRIPAPLVEQMEKLEAATAGLDTLELWIAFDYGGRAELVEAARRLVEDGVQAADVDERGSRLASRSARPPRDRPAGADLGRAPDLELPPLGRGVRRVRLHRHAVARLRSRRVSRQRWRSSGRAADGSAADEPAVVTHPGRGGASAARPRRWSTSEAGG